MQCIAHPTRAASNTCATCNHWLCDECTVFNNGRIICKSCYEEFSQSAETAPPPHPVSKRISGTLLLLFSVCLPPGANYMYMGLIKRGLTAMCGFFLIIYLMVTVRAMPFTLLFAFSIPILVITCFFDSFHLRRRINNGEYVEDSLGDVFNNILKNKPLAIMFLVVIAFTFAGKILGIAVKLISSLVPIVLILFALYIIFRKKD